MKLPLPVRLRRLEWRLPAVIAGLLVLVVSVVSSISYGTLRQSIVEGAGIRIENAAMQLASLLSRQVETFVARAVETAGDERLARALATTDTAVRARADAFLDSLAAASGQFVRIELRDGAGALRALGQDVPDEPRPPPWEPSFEDEGPAPRVSGFRRWGDRLTYAVAASVPDAADPAGTLVYHLVLTGSGGNANRIAEMIGSGAALRIGAPGGAWTDLAVEVPPPPGEVGGDPSPARYTLETGEVVVGAGAPVPPTPWMARVELPETAVLAPARVALARMLPVGGIIVLVGAAIGWTFGRNIAGRLGRLNEAVSAVAAGARGTPLPEDGADELAEVARAFNAMAAEVEGARSRLEQTVAARTEALRESEQRFRTLATVAPDAIVTAGLDGRVSYANPGAERLFGYDADALIGSPLNRLLPELDLDGGAPADPDEPALRPPGTLELTGRRADGSAFPVELSMARDLEGGPISFTGLVRDITRRRTAEQALERYAASLEVANAELEAFSYSVSHDLRAPLRAIHGFSQAVMEDQGPSLPARARDDLERVCAAADHMSRLIDDLLELSRAARAEMREEEVDLGAMARDILAELAADAPERRVAVRIAPRLVARGDRRLLAHVLRNLLANAWKFTSRKDEASIEVGRHEDGERAFFVRDDGAGFDPAYADKLFKPFQRLHAPRDFEGTGVGLALVARIVRRHGGRVDARGSVGGGATFSFTLPGSPAP